MFLKAACLLQWWLFSNMWILFLFRKQRESFSRSDLVNLHDMPKQLINSHNMVSTKSIGNLDEFLSLSNELWCLQNLL